MTEEPGTAFLDLASNLLAVVMIVTLFSLLSLESATRQMEDPRPRSDPSVRFRTPQRLLFPPLARFYLVVNGGVWRWQEEAIIEQLLDDPQRFNGRVPGGRYNWQPDQRGGSDVDAYRLEFWPEGPAVEPPTADAELLAQLSAAYQAGQGAPVFVVYPSGMDAFARLYPLLEESHLPFRWFTREAGSSFIVGRSPAQFLDHGIYW